MDRRAITYVIATTVPGTRCAMERARELANGAGTRLVLLVPHVVSFGVPVGRATEDPAVIAGPYRALAESSGLDATVRVCLCRDRRQVTRLVRGRCARVVIGGRRRRWWATEEQRLSHLLERAGHEVVFVDAASRAVAWKERGQS